MAAVEIHGLSKQFGSVTAVDSIDLTIEEGEFVTLLGPSGCGKTTTLRCIAGLEEPDGGTITLGSTVVWSSETRPVPTRNRNLGMVFQSYAVWPHMTVYENVAYPLRVKKTRSAEISVTVAQVLKLVGLEGYAERYPGELSGGQQQRVALARAVAPSPAVILYDEPLSNLDARLREEMRTELMRLHDRLGTTAVLVTHDQEEAMTLSDKIYVMRNGVIVQGGTPTEVFEHPKSSFVGAFMGDANLLEVTGLDNSSDGPYTTAALGSAGSIRVMPAAIGHSGGAQQVLIRPHRISFGSHGVTPMDHNAMVGLVKEVVYLGDRIRYLVAFGDDQSISVETVGGAMRPAIDDSVTLIFSPRDCLLI